jgi:hypothetical protein
LVFAEMLQRVRVRDGQSAEDARRSLESMLRIRWTVPGRGRRSVEARDPRAPWWWHSAEEASDSFLKSMGVVLT